MKAKASLFTMALIAVTAGTIIYLPTSMILDYYDSRDKATLMRERRLARYLAISQSLYRAGADEELTKFLQQIVAEGDVTYFAIYKNQQLRHFEPSTNALAGGHTYEERAPHASKDLIDDTRSERSEFLADDTLLTIGLDKRYERFLRAVIFGTDAWKVLLQDIIMVILLAAAAFYVHTRDLLKLKKQIMQTGRITEGLDATEALSAESEAIVAGLRGYASSERNLKSRHDQLMNQVLPALKRELFSGQAPPYTFDCTLVRTDINGFSQIFNGPYRDRFAEHIDAFFTGLAEITSRYDGLIYEFVGDEAIYYFKDTPETSTPRAMDAIRDIHALASEINKKTQLEGHRFTVKSALAHGTLRFGKQVDGFSLSGGVLIETVRILSTVTAKDDNQLYFAARHIAHLRSDSKTEVVGRFALKGYSEDIELVRATDSTSIDAHLEKIETDGFDFVSQHRSDPDLIKIIDTAHSHLKTWSLEQQLALVQALRATHTYKSDRGLSSALRAWLAAVADHAATHSKHWRLASAILMIYPRLISKEALTDADRLTLESMLAAPEKRTVANAVDVFGLYGLDPEAKQSHAKLTQFAGNDNNRIAANALIHAGIRELTPHVLKQLEAMIFARGTDDARRSSGLYALGEIARIIKARDPVYYATRVDLLRLLTRAEALCTHDDPAVARQAKAAIAKRAA